MILIGICGASGRGKSTLAEELNKALGACSTIIKQDSYYLDFPDLSFEERSALNFDEPKIFDHEQLLKDVIDLGDGKKIVEKQYDFTTHRRIQSNKIIEPTPILIIEGIHAFYDKKLCNKMFLKLYIKVEESICLLRRIQRDINERGRTIESITHQYVNTVKPMYEKYIKNYVNDADIIIANGGKNAAIVDILASHILNSLDR